MSRQAGSAVAPGPLGPRPAFPAWCRELLRVLRELKSIKMTQSDFNSPRGMAGASPLRLLQQLQDRSESQQEEALRNMVQV